MKTDTFGARLKSYRLRARLTQEELAEQASMSVRALSDLERGVRRMPRQDTLALLADALHLSAEERAHLAASVPRHRGPARAVDALTPVTTAALPWPVFLTRLIGREREESAAAHLLRQEDVRLLTLTGPAGVGKTRLALQLAESQADRFADGVQIISLAALQEQGLVLSALAEALDVHETASQSLLDHLKRVLHVQQRLLVLDNFEQLLAAAPLLVDLLAACPQVKMLVTSRARLQVRGEYELVVPPLALPDPSHLPALADLGQYGAVALFVDRAGAVQPTFALTEAVAPLVAELCVRLDGLPLAIELAAPRLKVFSIAALVAHLQDRLALLTGGARDLPERQQTMRQAIGWSYALLSADQQQFFRRLAVFAGSWTLAAAEQICGAGGEPPRPLLDQVATLVDQSLVQLVTPPDSEAPRFQLLETLRSYGLEQLEQAGEAEAQRHRHLVYYLALAEEADSALYGNEQTRWLERLTQEQSNLQAALGWARAQGEVELWLRLASSLWFFWYLRGHLSEGRRWLEEALVCSAASPERVRAPVRARALKAVGTLAHGQGAYVQARTWLEESAVLFRQLGDQRSLSAALNNLALVEEAQGDYPRAKALHEESLALRRARGDRIGLAASLVNLGTVATHLGELSQAEQAFAESLLLFQEIGDRDGVAIALTNLGDLLWHRGHPAEAERLLQEALQIFRELDDPLGSALVLTSLGQVARFQGALEAGRTYFTESLTLFLTIGNQRDLVVSLEGLAGLIAEQGQRERAVQLFGRAAALREVLGASGSAYERQVAECDLAQLGVVLGEDAVAAALTAGRTRSLEQVLADLPSLRTQD
jgi:predicted ATPase/DNA-binding XRE family transcriptional regulator